MRGLIESHGVLIDTVEKFVWVNGELLELPPKAIDLFFALVEQEGKLITKEELLNLVWKDSFVEESVIPQNIYILRKAFSERGIEDDLIKNVPKRGYRFAATVVEVEEQSPGSRGKEATEVVGERAQPTNSESFDPKLSSNESADIPLSSGSRKRLWVLGSAAAILSVTLLVSYWFWGLVNKGLTQASPNIKRSDQTQFLRLTDSGTALFPNISRDKKNLAYVRKEDGRWSIVLQHLASRSETTIVEPQQHELRSINFSLDGSYVFYASRNPADPESTIYKVPIYGGASQKVMSRIRQQFSISPDGKRFAFFRYDPEKQTGTPFLMTADIDGTNEKIVLMRNRNESFKGWETYPDWSPDGKKLVVTGSTKSEKDSIPERRYFLIVDIETGKETVVSTPDLELPHQAFWLRDGKSFLISAKQDPSQPWQLFHLSYPEGEVERITNDTNNYRDFRVSYDSSTIVAMNQKSPSNLYLMDLIDPAQLVQLTSETTRSNGRYGLVWTPDGKSLAFTKSESFYDSELWKIQIDSKGQQQLTFDEDKSVVKITLMPDGESLLFSSNRTGDWHFWQIDIDGRNLRRFTSLGNKSNPEISVDGEWLLYVSPARSPLELKREPLSGGKAETVLKNAGGVVKASPTDPSRLIASYFDSNEKKRDPWKYVLVSLNNNKIEKDLGFVKITPTFEWRNDGKGIFFGLANDLVYLSLEDNSIKKVRNLGQMKITNLSVSPDGKRLALSAENSTSNIFKISGFSPQP